MREVLQAEQYSCYWVVLSIVFRRQILVFLWFEAPFDTVNSLR